MASSSMTDFSLKYLLNLVFLGLVCLTADVLGSSVEFVTCGSVLKLLNVRNNVRLHSHEVKYGSGSGQQSVTAVEGADDHNSYWQIRAKVGAHCRRGEVVNCSQQIRLTHVQTKKNLHSHHFQSPLSNNQEVSAFGDNGEGDEGDNWTVICPDADDEWMRRDPIRLKHSVTGKYLYVSGDTFGRPIHGQREVSCYHSTNDGTYWKAAEGIFVKPDEDGGVTGQQNWNKDKDHDEL